MDPIHTLPRRIKVSELVAGDQLLLATGQDGKLFPASEEFDSAVWAPLRPLNYVDQDGRGEPAAISTSAGLLYRHPAETVIVRRELDNPEAGSSTTHQGTGKLMALIEQFGQTSYDTAVALHAGAGREKVCSYEVKSARLLAKIQQELWRRTSPATGN